MWKVCFKELRALTITKQLSFTGLNVNPMELNDLYEHVWNLGILLQTEKCLSILEPDFRPWPKVPNHPILIVTTLLLLEPMPVAGARGRSKQCGVLPCVGEEQGRRLDRAQALRN